MGEEVVPVFESKKPGKNNQCAVPDGANALEVTPKTFQGRFAQGLAGAFPYEVAEAAEISGRFGLDACTFLDSFQEFLDFRCGVVHGICIMMQKCDDLGKKESILTIFAEKESK